jgi:hypothetical protein
VERVVAMMMAALFGLVFGIGRRFPSGGRETGGPLPPAQIGTPLFPRMVSSTRSLTYNVRASCERGCKLRSCGSSTASSSPSCSALATATLILGGTLPSVLTW